MPVPAPSSTAQAADLHTRGARAAAKRVDALEERLVEILQPILEQAGARAASRFTKMVTNHLTAAALRDADAAALARIPAYEQPGGFGYRLRPVVLTAAAANPDSTMIALKPYPEEAAALEQTGGEPAETLHVTLAYLGSTEGDLEEIRAGLAAVAASHAPLAGVIGGVGRFEPPGVAILLPDVPGLVELRVAVTEALVDAGAAYGRDHGFEAHITIDAKPDPETLMEALTRTAQKPVHFDALLVVRGDEVLHEIPLVGPRPLTAAGEHVGWTPPAADELIDVDQLVGNIRAKTDPVRNALVETAMTATLKEAGVSFDVTNPLTKKVLSQAGSQVKGIAATTQLNVMRIIDRSYTAGLSITDTAKAIRAGMTASSESRARLIARTELAGAANGGSLAAAQIASDALGALYKIWLTAPGAPHPRHEEYEGLDGQTVPLDDPFDVGGEALQFPGDPAGDPGEVCNCRCALAYTETAPVDVTGGTPGAGLSDAGVSDSGTAALEAELPETPPPGDTVSVMTAPFVRPDVVERIKATGLDATLRDLKPTSTVGQETFTAAPTTEGLYKVGGAYMPDGKYVGGAWTPEREALHQDVVAAHFKGRTPPPKDEKPTAVFTAGGSASGKGSSIIDIGNRSFPLEDLEADAARISPGPEHDKLVAKGDEWAIRGEAKYPDVILMNPDIIKEMLPEYGKLRDAHDLYAASGVHEESSAIGKTVARLAQERGYNVVLDTTGASSSFAGKLEQAAKDGYTVKVRMSNAATNEAIMRAMARGDRSGRYVSTEALKGAHRGASAQLAIWKDLPSVTDWKVYDSTGAVPGAPPTLVAVRADGLTTVYDEEKFKAILAKANEVTAAPGSAFGKAAEATAADTAAVNVPDVLRQAEKDTAKLAKALQAARIAREPLQADERDMVEALPKAVRVQLEQAQRDLSSWDLATYEERLAAEASGADWYARLASLIEKQPVTTLNLYRALDRAPAGVTDGSTIHVPISDWSRDAETATQYGDHVLVLESSRSLDVRNIDNDPAPFDRRLTGGDVQIDRIEEVGGQTFYYGRMVNTTTAETMRAAARPAVGFDG